MSEKKINKWVFMALATLFNLALCIALFIVLVVLVTFVAIKLNASDTVMLYGSLGALTLSFILSFVIYNKVMKWAIKKWNLEEVFEKRR